MARGVYLRLETIALFVLLSLALVGVLFPSPAEEWHSITGFVVHEDYSAFSDTIPGFSSTPASLRFATSENMKSLSLAIADDAIYYQGWYSYDGSTWQAFTFPDAQTQGWILDGSATKTLQVPRSDSIENYVIVYSCTDQTTQWNCHDGRWQLYQFTTVEENTPPATDTSLLLHYTFDSISGSTVNDASNANNDGVLHGPVVTSGPVGSALNFDGVNDYIDAGNFDITGTAMTIVGWVRFDQITSCAQQDYCSQVRFVSKATGVQEQDHYWKFGTWYDNGPKLRFRLKTDGVTSTLIAHSGNLQNNIWTHVAAVYDGSMMRLYKDGVLVGSQSKSGSISTNSNVDVWVGDNPPTGTRAMDGAMDDIRIYSRALSQNDIATLMNGGNPPTATCDDKVQNQGELGVDCGGPCSTSCSTGGSVVSCQNRPGEFLVADEVYTYDGSLRGFKWWEYSDMTNVPTNWKTPYDYERGEFYTRFEIISQPTSQKLNLQFGFWQDSVSGHCERETMSSWQELAGSGSISEKHSSPTTWWEIDSNKPVDFSRPQDFCHFGVPLWDYKHDLVSDYSGVLNSDQNGWDSRVYYHPLTVRATIVAVAQGQTFSGWDCWLGNSGSPSSLDDLGFSFQHHFIDANLPFGGASGSPSLADYDNDGDLDFTVGQETSSGAIYLYEYQAANNWQRHTIDSSSHYSLAGHEMDVDNDGWMDLVVGSEWYENRHDSSPYSFSTHTYDSSVGTWAHDVGSADMNNDGKLDVVLLGDGGFYWYDVSNPYGTWSRSSSIGGTTHGGYYPEGLVDLDGDDDVDIVRANSWFENRNNGGYFIEHDFGVGSFASIAGRYGISARSAVVDVNNDNRLDIVMMECDETDGEAGILFNNGGSWSLQYLPQTALGRRSSLHSVAVHDFNLDGRDDIITVDQEDFIDSDGLGSPRWYLWEDTTGSWVEHVLFDNGLGGHDMRAGDVDGDGDYDLVSKVWQTWSGNAISDNNHADFIENKVIDGNTVRLDNGVNLNGWTVNNGNWFVENGAIIGMQTASEGLLVSDASYGNVDVAFEVWPDYMTDTGVLFRHDYGDRGYQVTVDYQPNNPMGGVYLNGLSDATNWNYQIYDEDEISGNPTYFSVEEWKTIWNPYGWNKFLVRITGNPPTIETFINGHKVDEFIDTQVRLGASGKIVLQTHSIDDDYTWPAIGRVRFRNIRVTPK